MVLTISMQCGRTMMPIPIHADWSVHSSGVMLIVELLGGMIVQSALPDLQCISFACLLLLIIFPRCTLSLNKSAASLLH